MNIKDHIKDPMLLGLFDVILKSEGTIHGGCLRDIFMGGSYTPKDIDIYYNNQSRIAKKSRCNEDFVRSFMGIFHKHPLFKGMHLHWLDEPLDDYSIGFEHCELGISHTNDVDDKYNCYPYILDCLSGGLDSLKEDNYFLDFDINSLYLEPDGIINSFIGKEKVPQIVENIRSRKCRLMRSDVDDDRITHILDKGFKCNLVPFL